MDTAFQANCLDWIRNSGALCSHMSSYHGRDTHLNIKIKLQIRLSKIKTIYEPKFIGIPSMKKTIMTFTLFSYFFFALTMITVICIVFPGAKTNQNWENTGLIMILFTCKAHQDTFHASSPAEYKLTCQQLMTIPLIRTADVSNENNIARILIWVHAIQNCYLIGSKQEPIPSHCFLG